MMPHPPNRSYTSKRHKLAALCQRGGLTRLLEWLPRQHCLVVLNYHRIGWAERGDGDPGVFSATPDDFESQVVYLKERFPIASLEDALAFVEGRSAFKGTAILLTIDDGYLDTYQYAFPVLKRHGVQATVFLCTSLVGSSRLPWWDHIAYLLRHARRRQFALRYPVPLAFNLDLSPWTAALGRLLALYKSDAALDKQRFLAAIADATGAEEPPPGGRLFLDWGEAAEMVASGMAVGSHTCAHEVLAHLSPARQLEELATAKRTLEARLRAPVAAFAYPVGSPTSFNRHTYAALAQTHYRLAFSYYGGVNRPRRTDRYDVRRIGVGPHLSRPLFRLAVVSAALTARTLL
jgi:peptidoglycan/xylan/chitin deacetylase (PgdA/CDA1 family)